MKHAWIYATLFVAGVAGAQDAIKLPPPTFQLSAKDFTKPSKSPPTTPDGFVNGLTGPANKCATLGYKAKMEAQMDYRSDATQAARSNLATCIDKARQAGADAYKLYAAGPANPQLKASAKDLFAAWIAYLPGWANGERGSQTEAEYQKTFSRFQVDAMTQ